MEENNKCLIETIKKLENAIKRSHIAKVNNQKETDYIGFLITYSIFEGVLNMTSYESFPVLGFDSLENELNASINSMEDIVDNIGNRTFSEKRQVNRFIKTRLKNLFKYKERKEKILPHTLKYHIDGFLQDSEYCCDLLSLSELGNSIKQELSAQEKENQNTERFSHNDIGEIVSVYSVILEYNEKNKIR